MSIRSPCWSCIDAVDGAQGSAWPAAVADRHPSVARAAVRRAAYVAGRVHPGDRLITDPLRLLTWGTDASFYRLVPRIVVVVDSEDEVVRLLGDLCAASDTPVTFRAAGTSLSGQAITDSVLVLLGDGWRRCAIGDGRADRSRCNLA